MKFLTLVFITIFFLEILIIYTIDNPENNNLKIFFTLIVQGICIYELIKSDERLERQTKLIKKYNRLKYSNYNLGKEQLQKT